MASPPVGGVAVYPPNVRQDTSLSRQTSVNQPPAGSGKLLSCRVEFLDGTHVVFRLSPKARGQTLFDTVCEHLQLVESDYFGLEYGDSVGNKYWLDLDKSIGRQLGLVIPSNHVVNFHFCVKFYTPDPVQLEGEFSRYLFVLQIRKDLATGVMPCQEATAALLAAYVVQAEEGDYSPENYRDYTYLLKYKFLPHQDVMFLSQVRDSHVQLAGQSPAEADLNFLETARRCEMYGVKMHPANDHEGVALNLAVAHMGIVVFQNLAKINTFSWAKIRKLSFKRKKFLIKLHPEGYGYYKDTVEFFFDSRNSCKNFWKKCIEHHGFFRCPMVASVTRSKTKIFPTGSSFRYHGRTQKEVLEHARESYGKRPSVHRSHGSTSRIRSSQSCGASLAATPLLPLARARDSRYNTTGGSRSRRSIQGENGALARSKSEPMEVAEVIQHDKSSDSGSRTLERVHRPEDRHPQPTRLSKENLPPHEYDEHIRSLTSTLRSERYEVHQTNGHHHVLQRETVDIDVMEGTTSPESQSPANLLSHRCQPTSEGVERNKRSLEGVEGSVSRSVSVELEELARKINGWKQQSSSSVQPSKGSLALTSFESKFSSLGESLRTLADDSMDGRKRRNPSDLGYFIAKELLNGERTYKKDLEVLCLHLKEELNGAMEIPAGLLQNLFALLQPIYNSQGTLLVEIEHRLSTWETHGSLRGGDSNHVGDLFLKQNDSLEQYCSYLTKLPELLQELDAAFRKIKSFEQFYRNFELDKRCYVPITSFMLKPAQRLVQYQNALERLLGHYGSYHSDVGACEAALHNFRRASGIVHDHVRQAEHFAKLVELQRDLLGVENLAVPHREFVREGILRKISKKGHDHLRMFILLTDTLIYTERASNTTAQFKLHGQMTVRGMLVRDAEPHDGIDNCFTITCANRTILLAANSAEEKSMWLHDLQTVIEQSKRLAYDKLMQYGSLKSCSSSDEVLEKLDMFPVSPAHTNNTNGSLQRQQTKSPLSPVISSRSNTTLHVCWHRNTTIGIRDLSRAFQLQLNGYLLRKFKNSDGWQKLWVVFTDFCLFFFKNNTENAPLACLPLIGYRVTVPSAEDNILKDHVFKLYFKTHVYFFRSDSQYTFNRWLDVIGAAVEPDRSMESPETNGVGMHV